MKRFLITLFVLASSVTFGFIQPDGTLQNTLCGETSTNLEVCLAQAKGSRQPYIILTQKKLIGNNRYYIRSGYKKNGSAGVYYGVGAGPAFGELFGRSYVVENKFMLQVATRGNHYIGQLYVNDQAIASFNMTREDR